MKKLIIIFINMKVLPVFLTVFNVCFWIFFRGGKNLFKNYPVTQIIKQEKFQFMVFLFLGVTLFWSFYSLVTKKKEYCILMTIISGIALELFFKGYDLAGEYFNGKSYYMIIVIPVIMCIIIGASLNYVFCVLFRTDHLKNKAKKDIEKQEQTLSIQNIAKYRSHLMGIAMLYIILFHTKTMKVNYNNEFLSFFVESGYLGVDIFVFLSGIGMAYSLAKGNSSIDFYKKRFLRIYPTYVPCLGTFLFCCLCECGCMWTGCIAC